MYNIVPYSLLNDHFIAARHGGADCSQGAAYNEVLQLGGCRPPVRLRQQQSRQTATTQLFNAVIRAPHPDLLPATSAPFHFPTYRAAALCP